MYYAFKLSPTPISPNSPIHLPTPVSPSPLSPTSISLHVQQLSLLQIFHSARNGSIVACYPSNEEQFRSPRNRLQMRFI